MSRTLRTIYIVNDLTSQENLDYLTLVDRLIDGHENHFTFKVPLKLYSVCIYIYIYIYI